jgi:hypothetical protein
LASSSSSAISLDAKEKAAKEMAEDEEEAK